MEFLVEAYVSRLAGLAPRTEDLALAADELTKEGTNVRFLRSIFVPAEETCFYLYEALSIECVRKAAARAGLGVARISEAVSAGSRRC